MLEKKRCQGIVSRLWKSRLGWSCTWGHFTLWLYQLICHSVDTGYVTTRGRTCCCHYTLVWSQSSCSSNSFPPGRQVPWPEAQKVLFSSPCALRQSALSAKNICTLSVDSWRVSISSKQVGGCKCKPLLHHSCTIQQVTWVLSKPWMPGQHTWKWSPQRNNAGINSSCFRNNPGRGHVPPVVLSQCYQGQFWNTFCHSIVVSPLSDRVWWSNMSTPAH